MPILAPKVTLQIIGAEQIQKGANQRVLLVGQKLSAGSAAAGVVSRNVPDSENSINALFGAKSHIAEMVRRFKAVNKSTPLDVLPLADSDEVSAAVSSATLTFSGTSTAAGVLNIHVVDKINYRVSVNVAAGVAAAAVATAVDAALGALEAKSPWNSAVAGAVVTVSSVNEGTVLNGAPIGVEGSVPGISVALTAFAGGAEDPVLTGVLAAVGNTRYQTIGWPSTYPTTALTSFLNARFNDNFEVLDGVGVTAVTNTYASLALGPVQNSQSLVILADNLVDAADHKGPAIQSLADVKVAEFCAVRSLRLTQDAPLASIMSTVASRDQFGGSAISTIPYHNTRLPGLSIPLPEDEYGLQEIQNLTDAGYTVAAANRAYNAVILGDTVTTYKTNAAGDPDTSFKYLNRVDASSAIREFFAVNYKARYAQTRLTNGEILPGRDMANEASIRTFSKRLYENLADNAITEKGPAASKDFDTNLFIELSVANGSAVINMAPLQVGQFRLILGTVAVKFSS